MPLNIRSEEVNRLADKLAAVARVSKTEAVRLALTNELELRQNVIASVEQLEPLHKTSLGYLKNDLGMDEVSLVGVVDDM